MNRLGQLFISLLGALVFALCVAVGPAVAAEEARLMERWLVNDALSERTVDHSRFSALLEKYRVSTPDGAKFNYGAVTPEDTARLDG